MEEKESEQLKQEIRQELKRENRKKLFIVLGIIAVIGLGLFIKVKIDSKSNIIQKESYSNSIELTTDNWKNYFEITTEIEERTDAFGDVSYSSEYIVIKLKEPYYSKGELQNTAIKLRNLQYDFDSEYIFEFNTGDNQLKKSTLLMGWEGKSIIINDLECTQIKGNLVY